MKKSKYKNYRLYKDYRIGKYIFTVKYTYMLNGGINGNPAVYVQVMEWHQPPRNLWEKISEFWKYNLDSGTWDTLLTDAALEDYAIDKCTHEVERRMNVERCDKEWEVM